ncbi:hypothetical protein [Allorhizobium sonneratiae]|uniref:hypothetical protein n=1 Tax=Allorhizobium sonneratiae TaxID=2934936 RepID=UPI002033FE96|nr:hypothetical protein [Allorhizobium sonneratiae]
MKKVPAFPFNLPALARPDQKCGRARRNQGKSWPKRQPPIVAAEEPVFGDNGVAQD